MTDYTVQYLCGLSGKDVVGMGITAVVARLDAVIKFTPDTELPFMEREKLIHQRLGNHHNGIHRYYGSLENALVLEYVCHGSIRQYLARHRKPVAFNPAKLD